MFRPGIYPERQLTRSICRMAAGFLSAFILLYGCTEPPEISLTFEEQSQIDTIYSKEVATLREEMDSLCAQITERDMQGLIDSIVRSRHEEEARMLQRIREENQE